MKYSFMFLIQVAEICCTQPRHTGIFLLLFSAKDAEHVLASTCIITSAPILFFPSHLQNPFYTGFIFLSSENAS